MKVLSEKDFADIVAWTPSGKAFNIIQPKLFTANILPSHFKQAKYSSFTRKLHRWGFMRHYRGPEAGAFFHKHFRRGRMDMVEKMTCAKPAAPQSSSSKNNTARSTAASNNDNAPAMGMIMDTSNSSRDSATYGVNNNNLMGGMMGHPLGLTQQLGSGGFNALMQQQQIPQQLLMQGYGGMPSAQQQMLLRQQQLQQQQQQQAMAAQQGGAPTGDTGLDAAIEMEVTRRLKERINAASFSRQALSMMQQPQQQQQGAPGAQNPNQAQSMMQQGMMGAAGHSMFGGAGMASPTLQGFPQGFKGFDRHQGGLSMLQDPFSNIQGAKTA